jgi:hypothetical protein
MVLALGAGQADGEESEKAPVMDEAGLFSPAARRRATAEIEAIREKYRVDLVIETTKESPPESEREKHAWWKARERGRVLLQWANDRAEELEVDGIYIVIFNGSTAARRDVRVVGWPAEWEVKVSAVKREQLRKQLARELRDDPDRALLSAIDTFRAQMELIRTPDPSPLPVWPALIVVGSLVGVWLLLVLVRSRLARRADGGPAPPLYQPAMMGALFGVPAAFWVHDQLFRFIPPESPNELAPADVFQPPVEPKEEPPPHEETSSTTPTTP